MQQPFVTGSIQTPVGNVPQISARLTWLDKWGSIKARWGVGRMNYAVDPGLYALGEPDDQSFVLVTANYKMSFDRLRETLAGRNVWIMVLDTDGINVWCAAGKKTFGTDEIIQRLNASGLQSVVSHRQLILPQLAGPGVAAHDVKKRSGFKIHYGPIRAKDLPAFLDTGGKATSKMRRKTFDIWERVVLIPVELVSVLKWSMVIVPAFFLLGGIGGPAGYWSNAFNYGGYAVFNLLGALLAGAVLTPICLPWLPGRAFSVKGTIMGLIIFLVFSIIRADLQGAWPNRLENLAWFFIVPALAAYLAMNFTGASSYTSLSGVKKEMKWALPTEIAAGIAGFGLWIGSRLIT